MNEIWLASAAILAGFVGLVWSADRFVGGSAAIANNAGISKLIIGMTIVAFGTSAPEIVVSIISALEGHGDLAVGNALGSNLANVGMVLAITALIAPLPIQRHLLTLEVPVLLFVTALAGVLLWDAKLDFWEGLVLLGALVPVLLIMTFGKKDEPGEEETLEQLENRKAIIWFISGLVLLIASAQILVWGAQVVALAFGVSPLIIGLTVIAIGTSLPELAASIMSAIKGHHDIALGNIIGSNIFNLLAVMAMPALIAQTQMESEVFDRDFVAMGGITLVLAVAIVVDYLLRNKDKVPSDTPTEATAPASGKANQGRLGRRIGVLLLLCYIGYYFWLFTPVA